MKRISIILILILSLTQLLAVSNFDEKNFYPNSIIVCFDSNAINSTTGEITIEQTNLGQVQIGLKSFDDLAKKYEFVDLERMFWVKNQKWSDDNGAYPMNIFRVTIKNNNIIEEALNALTKDKNIIFAEYEAILKQSYIPNDPTLDLMWHIPIMQTPELWDYVRGDTTIVVAIIDSGAKWNHEDLRDNIFINYAEMPGMTINWANGTVSGGDAQDNDGNGKVDDVIGWDFFVGNNNPYQSYDGNDHGTHVAGCAGAVSDNNVGIASPAMHIKLLISKHQSHTQYSNNVTNGYGGIYYAVDTGADIINCSWGGTGGSGTANTAVNYANSEGILVVSAAGNEYQSNDTYPSYPSDATNGVAVAASDQNDIKANFSNWGDAIDITAPGVAIRSTIYHGTHANAVDAYAAYQGTSMASPVAAGIAAMIKSVHPEYTPAQIRQRMSETADPMPNEPYFEQGKLGGGRINAFKAVLSEKIPNLEIYGDLLVEELEGDGDGVPNVGETVSVTFSLTNLAGWSYAAGVQAVLSTETEGVEIEEGNLTFSDMLSETIVTSDNQAVVSISSDVNTLNIPMLLTVTCNQEASNPYPYTKEIPVTLNLSMNQAGWPLVLDAQSPSAPIVANLDGTGKKLITIVSGVIHVVDSEKNYATGFPYDTGANTLGQLAIGDVTGDEDNEIVVANSNGWLRVISASGELLNEYDTQGNIRNAPIIADLNNDGQNEIIVGNQSRKVIVLNGNDLSVWPNYPVDLGGVIITNLAVGDINNNGNQEIVINLIGSPGALHILDPVTGQNISGFPLTTIGASNMGSSIGNLDDDDDLEIIFAGSLGTNCPITIVKSDGSILHNETFSYGIKTEIAIVDLNNDGQNEIIFGDYNGDLYVKNVDFENVTGFPLNVGIGIESSPVFADFDSDGNREIVFGDNNGKIHVVKYNGTYINAFPVKVSDTPFKTSPWVGNFDSDADGDILLNGNTGVLFLDYKESISDLFWNTFRANFGNTANNADISTPNTSTVIPLFTNQLQQNYPNPFNPETQISFSLKNSQDVKLSIYNIKGQLVKTLVNEKKSAGAHTVVWKGLDEYNKQVSSGIYFYKLETATYVNTMKMLLMK